MGAGVGAGCGGVGIGNGNALGHAVGKPDGNGGSVLGIPEGNTLGRPPPSLPGIGGTPDGCGGSGPLPPVCVDVADGLNGARGSPEPGGATADADVLGFAVGFAVVTGVVGAGGTSDDCDVTTKTPTSPAPSKSGIAMSQIIFDEPPPRRRVSCGPGGTCATPTRPGDIP